MITAALQADHAAPDHPPAVSRDQGPGTVHVYTLCMFTIRIIQIVMSEWSE